MSKSPGYTPEHAAAGLDTKFPEIETWPNQFPGYEILVDDPQCYRNLGIFQENVVNQVLEDVVKWAKPVWAEVKGEFRPRGGIATTIVAKWPRPKGRRE